MVWFRAGSLFVFLVAWQFVALADNKGAPDFKEVYDLLRTNLTGVDETTLNRAAVQGLLDKLDSKVRLVDSEGKARDGTNAVSSVTGSVMESRFGYIRINALNTDAHKAFADIFQKLSTNRLKGLIVDLRYAGGNEYADAAAIADLFLPNEQPLVDWGKGMRKSSPKSNPITIPVAVLVNGKTSGAAEALAGVMRQTEIGLLIGAKTSGQASIAKEFPLSDGSRLLIPTTPVVLGSGKPMSSAGLAPDIAVDVAGEDEHQYYIDAYKVLPRASTLSSSMSTLTNEAGLSLTNRVSRRRFSEADLVRMQRDGTLELETTPLARDTSPSPPGIQDPVLNRALDLLKGLAVVQQFRPAL